MAAEMGPSSPASSQIPLPLPEGVSDADLYEGPRLVPLKSGRAAFVEQAVSRPPTAEELVRPIPIKGPEPPVPTASIKSQYAEVLAAALDVLAIKIHALLGLVGAIGFWGFAVLNPDPWRLVAAACYSVLVCAPMLWIYHKANKGD